MDWNPGVNSVVTSFLAVGDTLYLGGWFTQLGGQARNGLAAVNATNGEITSWSPNANDAVLALARLGSTIFVGGIFDHLGGQPRRGVAAVGALTGAVEAWNADTDNSGVEALTIAGNTVYVGGGYNQIGGLPRRGLAAVDARTGTIYEWNPEPVAWDLTNPRIRALAVDGATLYAGGDFSAIGGQPRICLAAVDTASGLADAWDPSGDGLVWSLARENGTLYVGGGFGRLGGLPSVGLAAFILPQTPQPAPTSFSLAQSMPNPTPSVAIIRYALPTAASVSLSVYDLQGRMIAQLLRHTSQDAGPHEIIVQTDAWKPGVYLYRLEAGGRASTRKMVVVR